MQNTHQHNPQQHHPQSLPDSVDQLFLSINQQLPVNSEWAHLQHPNYQHFHQQLNSLDDVMSEPEPHNTPHTTSTAPHLSHSTRSHSHLPHSNNFPPPHTPPSQRLPPRAPPSRPHPIFSQSSFHQSVTTSDPFSPAEQLHPSFALPENIAGSYVTKLEPGSSSTVPHYFTAEEQQQEQDPLSPPISYNSQPLPHNAPGPATNHIDSEKYVREAAFIAEKIKVQYRDKLKKDQLRKENHAKSRGSPMTAKEKERERSRRESAVTRKRAEVYIRELEKFSRRLPWVEMRLKLLENELHRLRNYVVDFEDATAQSQIGHLTPTSMPQIVKSEPGLHLSPASQRTSTVMNQMQQLDLRLQNAGESG